MNNYIYIFVVFASLKFSIEDTVIECEPYSLNRSHAHFVEKYNMTTKANFLVFKVLHESKYRFPEVKAGNADLFGGSVPVATRVSISIRRANQFEPLKTLDRTIIYHFYYGDSATCHQFNPETGEYIKKVIGFHTLEFNCIVERGNSFTIDFEQHVNESFALIGATVFRRRTDLGNIRTFSKEESLELFPQHKAVIEYIYSRI